ncbi:MAG: PilT/PilU family type 4a pilus ATPase [Opitutales bacterium]|nr:PilT/PilU family type 4a pilus ATPase [Opitutales bacterium]MCH8539567.1 PilT/PilU family type 4a pilus ATPase [Opitutales bacterium]
MSDNIFNELLQLAAESGASDIHIKSHKMAVMRIDGELREVEMEPISTEDIGDFVERSLPPGFLDRWHEDGQIDFSHAVSGVGRFRVNAFRQRGTYSVVFRFVSSEIPSFSSLSLVSPTLKRIGQAKDGIALVCGATGSGKSSTLAAILNEVNNTSGKHVVTLEDPIEYNFEDKKSYFNQREVGIDTPSFADGLRAALRQDPDLILIGEMRDRNTFETALSAAETGHFVLSTLHSLDVRQAIMRLFEFFPVDEQDRMRRQIAQSLRAIICQRLIPALEGGGRLPALEILMCDSLSRSVVAEGAFDKITGLLDNEENGSQSFNKDLQRLIQEGRISKADGLKNSPNPKALEMNLKGIKLSGGRILG